MEMVRNFGYITDEQYKEIDYKCGRAGKVLPKECEDLLDKVIQAKYRLMILLMDTTSMMPLGPAMPTETLMAKDSHSDK